MGRVTGICALTSLMLDDWQTPGKIRSVVVLFALGGAVAFPFGIFLARLVSLGRQAETAFAAAFLALTVTTLAATAGLFGLQYREYYAQWHADAFTWIWFLQFTHTLAAALYQFAVLGLRLYFPLGFVALLAASLAFARRRPLTTRDRNFSDRDYFLTRISHSPAQMLLVDCPARPPVPSSTHLSEGFPSWNREGSAIPACASPRSASAPPRSAAATTSSRPGARPTQAAPRA